MRYSEFLQNVKKCPFCDIADRIVRDNKSAYITYSIAPYHKDHLLIIPKRHVEHVSELSSEEMGDIDSLQREGMAIMKRMGYEDVSILVRDGSLGKSVPHLHYHVIPEIAVTSVTGTADREVLAGEALQKEVARILSFV